MTDGEVLRVRVLFRSEEYNDIIVDALESMRPQPYALATPLLLIWFRLRHPLKVPDAFSL
jgi:hypothetical protein